MNNPGSQSLSENQFLSTYLTHPLRCSLNQISDVVRTAPSLCALKDAKSKKYLLVNQFETELSGLQPDELVGLTVEDLEYGLYHGSKDALVKLINELDHEVEYHQHFVSRKMLYLTYQGFIQSRHLMRIPFIQNGKTLAIFIYDEDLTSKENLFELFKLYQKYYLSKHAIEKFLSYFEVDTYFRDLPSNSEVNNIIAMTLQPSHKQVAKLLNISHKTVAHHVYLLKSKLKENITLDRVIKNIRSKWSVRAN